MQIVKCLSQHLDFACCAFSPPSHPTSALCWQPQLASVYTCYLRSILSHAKCGAAVWSEPAHVKRLAVCMVELYEQLQAKFPPDETQRHLLLTPRELSAWAFGLLRYGTRREEVENFISFSMFA